MGKLKMVSVKNVPIRSSFVSRAVGKCWRLAKLEVERVSGKQPHYFLGGTVFAYMVEQHSLGNEIDDPNEFAAFCYLIAIKQQDYEHSEDQRNTIIARAAEGWEGYREWLAETGFSILGVEIEVRCQTEGGRDAAIKIDILASLGGEIYLLDIKTFGMWGKSIAASHVTEQQLRQSVQLAMYSYFLEKGGDVYIGKPIGRYETNKAVRAKYEPLPGRIKPDHIGYINIAMLTKRRRDSKNGKAGERRGDPLSTLPYDPSMKEYAMEQVQAVEIMMTFNQWPRTQRFERGQSSCGGCAFTNDCWGGRANAGDAPSWLNRSKK
jgi:hypothetical protein